MLVPDNGLYQTDAICRWFFERSNDPVLLLQIDPPLATQLSEEDQVEYFYGHAFVAECNAAMAKLLEYPSAAEMAGVPFAEVMPREQSRNIERLRAFIGSRYELLHWECETQMDHQPSRWTLDTWMAPEENGSIHFCWFQSRDITDLKRTEALLRQNEQRLQLAIKAGRLGLWDWDLRTDELIWSDGHYRLLGLDPSSAPATYETFMSVVHPQDRPRMETAFWQARQNGQEYAEEFRVSGATGGERWLSLRAIASFDEKRNPVRITGILSDITIQKRAELALEREKERVERDSRAKDQFLAALSHELRTPLTPVLMSISALADSPEIPPHVREEVELIRRNVQAEARLIDDLFDRTGIVRGKVQLRREPLDLHIHLTQTCRGISRGELFQKQIALELRLAAGHHCVNADPQRLGQVFSNLIRNAIKFTPAKGRIEIRTSNIASRVRVEIADNGLGIAPEMLSRIFEPFEQGGHEVTNRFGGLGLGLAISKALVENHGGSITAMSEGLGKGATFVVELDTIADSECPPAEPPPEKLPDFPTKNARQMRVLLLEDHEPTLEILAKLLRKKGYEVGTARRLSEARHLVQMEPWDTLICDLGLPDGSGIDFLKALRAAGIDVPAIALSGYGMEGDVDATKEAGFGEHLTKPVEWPKLQAALNRVPQRPGANSTLK